MPHTWPADIVARRRAAALTLFSRILKPLAAPILTLIRSVSEARVYPTGSSIPPVIDRAMMENASLAYASG